MKMIVVTTPKIASNVVPFVKSPNPTRTASFFTIIPAFWNPRKAMNNPIPAATANFNSTGIALMIFHEYLKQ